MKRVLICLCFMFLWCKEEIVLVVGCSKECVKIIMRYL